MRKKTKKSLEAFEYSDFSDYKIWQFASDQAGDIDYDYVVPVRKEAVVMESDVCVMIPITATLSSNEKYLGLASVNGDSPEILPGPSLFVNNDYFTLMLPPAPPFVIEQQGPKMLAHILNIPFAQVFPLTIATEVIFNKTGKAIIQVLRAREIA